MDPTLPPVAQAKFVSVGCINSFGQKGPIRDAKFEIEFLDGGIEAFSFTFG